MFGAYHSLFGDMRPGNLETAKKGGHLFLPEIKTATHALENFQQLSNGFFSFEVKHIADTEKSEIKTFFPYGKTPLDCAKIIVDAIKNHKSVDMLDSKNSKIIGIRIVNQQDQEFKIFIQNKSATFYPEK